MYLTREIIISEKRFPECFALFDCWSREAREIENQAIFVMRQNFFSFDKDDRNLTEHEKVVFHWVNNVINKFNVVKPKICISNTFLGRVFNVNQLFVDSPLYSKVKQNQLNKVQQDFSNFFKSLKAYRKCPDKFLGRPQIPNYHKNDRVTLYFDNQCFKVVDDCVEFIVARENNVRLKVGEISGIKEIKVIPFYDRFKVCIIHEIDDVEVREKRNNIAGIDFGLANLATIVSNVDGMNPILYKGGYVKAINQKFNKDRAKFVSLQEKTDSDQSKVLDIISRKRNNRIKAQFHKISSDIVKELKCNNIDCVVLGWNEGLKQNINIGHANNQNFVICPLKTLVEMIEYKCQNNGIEVIRNEESYTSKASFLDFDSIPVYDGSKPAYKFSGKRIKRGLYKSKNGTMINADVNGAANIVRKVFEQAFNSISDFSQFSEVKVKNFYDLNQCKSNPAMDRGCVTSQ